ALLLLSQTASLLHFYLLFCLARMNWAGPFDLGIYGALSNWFVQRRNFATSIATLAQQAGLVAMPLIAQLAIVQAGWRAGWLAIGAVTLLIGFVPVWLLLVRRPEDLGLAPDGRRDDTDGAITDNDHPAIEPAFSRRDALRTPAFWLVLAYPVLLFPVKAGGGLHQAPYQMVRASRASQERCRRGLVEKVRQFRGLRCVGNCSIAGRPRLMPSCWPMATRRWARCSNSCVSSRSTPPR